jgi:class 3 adenylate cyclase/tetratricopeptide (TPR) repeat protein
MGSPLGDCPSGILAVLTPDSSYTPLVPVCRSCGEDNPERARFCLACGSSLEPAAPAREVRKTVTILFCDVAGSTSLGERLDPETLRRVMTRYFEAMKAALERHGGTVEKFIGDAVMAVFGIPVLHEDDALRAVRAAAEMRDALEGLNEELARDQGATIGVRIGINTGQVVAGDASSGQGMVTGDAVNVAARLEQAAATGEILIGAETEHLVRDAVDVEPVDPLSLKGKEGPVPAFRLLSVQPATPGYARRLDSPIVGRDHEQRLLAEAFARCRRERACQLFTMLGSPGVGKSRLAEEFARTSRLEADAIVLSGRCLPYGDGITFWPVAEIVHEAAGIREGDSPEVARDRIAGLLEGADDARLIADRVAQMAGLLDAGANPTELFWSLRRLFEEMARRSPLVVEFDDMHWAEPTLLDLVEHVADWSRDAPILLLCLARPELLDRRPTWGGGKMNATSILLEALSDQESEALIGNLLGRAELAEPARLQVVGAAEGNPLFVEQMLSMLIDEGLLQRDDGHWIASGDLSEMAVPPTIHALLAARLDRLQYEERAVIERASVVGKTFYTGAVTEMAPEPLRLQVPTHLMTLVRKELIRPDRSDVAGEDAFRFRHLLIRDAAYESMPKETRADLHERFAGWLERMAGPRLAEYGEILGYHLEQAYRYRAELGPVDDRGRELAGRAAAHLSASGHRATNRGDMRAAVHLLTRAAELLPVGSPDRLDLFPRIAVAMVELGEWNAADRLLEAAIEEAQRAGDRRVEWLSRAQLAQIRSHTEARESDDRIVREAIDVLQEFDDDYALSLAWFAMSENHNLWGREAASIEALEHALEHARRAGDQRMEAEMMGQLGGRMYFGPTRPEEAIRRAEEMLAGLPGHRLAEASALRAISRFRALQGHFEDAREMAARALAIVQELGLDLQVASTRGFTTAAIEWLAGDPVAAERELRANLAALERMGEWAAASTAVAVLGDMLYLQGRYEEALEATRRSEAWAAPEDLASQITYRRVRGKVLARLGEIEEGIRLAQQGVEIAEGTDFGFRGDNLMDLAEVLRLAGHREGAATAARRALELYEEKGNEVGAGWARATLAELENGRR